MQGMDKIVPAGAHVRIPMIIGAGGKKRLNLPFLRYQPPGMSTNIRKKQW
jgi:hypothetical protein